jgi:hypothetical protein
MSALFEFECQVAVNGYQINFDRNLQARSKRIRRFDLFKVNSSAFLEFAQTPATEDGIKDFADRYGLMIFDDDEPIEWWFAEIRQMHRMVELWEMSKSTRDYSKLIRAVRKKLILAGFEDERPGVKVELHLREDPLSASARLRVIPETLLTALWTQLVLAIDGNLTLRGCVQCRKWFTLEAGRGRSDKQYCSNACRMRAYRERKSTG